MVMIIDQPGTESDESNHDDKDERRDDMIVDLDRNEANEADINDLVANVSVDGGDWGDGSIQEDNFVDEEELNEQLALVQITSETTPAIPPGMINFEPIWHFDEMKLHEGDDNLFKMQVGAFLANMASEGGVSKQALQELYVFFVSHAEDFSRLKRRGNIHHRCRTLREKTMQDVSPSVETNVYGMRQGFQYLMARVNVLRRDLQTSDVIRRLSRIRLTRIISHVYQVHRIDINAVPQQWREIEINSDGVPISTKGSWSFHIVSLRFIPCGTPYLWMVHQMNKSRHGRINARIVYKPIVDELNQLGFLTVKRFALDSKERKDALGMTTCNAYFSCSVCEIRGMKVEGDFKSRVSYPSTARPPRIRTRERVERAARKYLNRRLTLLANRRNVQGAMWQCKGVIRRSPLLNLQNFDMLQNTTGDFMHFGALGMGRKIYRVQFMERHMHLEAYETKREANAAQKNQAKELDDFLPSIRIATEMGRRTRKMVFSRFKATEWRNFCLYFFLYVGWNIMSGEDGMRRKVLILFTFVCRALYINDMDYNFLKTVDMIDIRDVMKRLSKLYQQSFGMGEVTFNEHLYFEHMIDQRERNGPLHKFSVFRYEDLYGAMRRAFVKGTPHEAKQLIESMYAKDYFFHKCRDERRMIISSRRSEKRDDSIITVRNKFYRVKRVHGEDNLTCTEIHTTQFSTPIVDLDDLPWYRVGVYKLGCTSLVNEEINENTVDGKGIIIGDFIMKVEKAWLLE